MVCSCDHIVRKLQENVEILTDKVRKLEAKKKCLLSEEEKNIMSKKSMLQLLDRIDQREKSTKEDVILFLKALSAGEKCVNLRIEYKISDHEHENLRIPGTGENIVTVFQHPVSIYGWSVQFETEQDIELRPINRDSPEHGSIFTAVTSYSMILTTPVKTKLRFVAQKDEKISPDRADWKIVSLPTSKKFDEINTRGLRTFKHEVYYNEEDQKPPTEEEKNEGQFRCLTWTVINNES